MKIIVDLLNIIWYNYNVIRKQEKNKKEKNKKVLDLFITKWYTYNVRKGDWGLWKNLQKDK